MSGYIDALIELAELNGPDQHYAVCTGFLGQDLGGRLSTEELCSEALRERAGHLQTLRVVKAAGRGWLLQGQLLVLVPTPITAAWS